MIFFFNQEARGGGAIRGANGSLYKRNRLRKTFDAVQQFFSGRVTRLFVVFGMAT